MPPRTRQKRGRCLSSAEEEGGKANKSATFSEEPGQKRPAQMAAETVGGGEQGGEGDAGRHDSEIFAKLDPGLLDCIICSKPLRSPIFQCEVGHVLCFVCRGKLRSMFLMVNTCVHIGNALTTVCIRSHESGSCYSTKISAIHRAEADKGRYVFMMDPHVASSSLHGGVELGSRFFLLVPRDLVDESTDELTINISIAKIKCAVHK